MQESNDFYSQVIHRTNGGQLPFIFQPNKDENSVGIMMLVTVGLILLIYFASNVNVDIEAEISVGEKNAKIAHAVLSFVCV